MKFADADLRFTPLETAIIQIVQANPGITAGQIGKRLGRDRNQIRRSCDRIVVFGEFTKRDNGNGFEFYPIGNGHAASPSGYTPAPALVRDDEPINVPFKDVTPDQPTFDSRLAGAPSTSRALIVPGQPQYMPGDARGRALGQHRQFGSAWDIRPRTFDGRDANGFAAFAGDPAEGGYAYEQIEGQAIREGVWKLQDDKAALENQLVAEREAHAEELAKVKRDADRDAVLGSMTRFIGASSAAALPAPKPKSLLQEAREERAAKDAEARMAEQARFRKSVANQMKLYPPDRNPHLYSHLDPEDWPEEFLEEDEPMDEPTPIRPLSDLHTKPNGHDAPAGAVAESDEGWPLGVKWSLAALTLGALVAMIVRFPLK